MIVFLFFIPLGVVSHKQQNLFETVKVLNIKKNTIHMMGWSIFTTQ
jgi:hypothetical protein